MRLQHWSAPVLGLLVVAVGTCDVFAQAEFGPVPPLAVWPASAEALPGYVPDDLGFGTPAVETPYGLYRYGHHTYGHAPFGPAGPPPDPALVGAPPSGIPGHHMVSVHPPGAAAYPPTMLPHPAISPFDHDFSQHRLEKGLWTHDFNSRGRRYYGGADFLVTRTAGPRGYIGHPFAMTYKEQVIPMTRQDPFDLEIWPDAMQGIQPFDPTRQTWLPFFDNDLEEMPAGMGFNYYDATLGQEMGNVHSVGLRLNWGFWDPDDSGMRFHLMWNAPHRNVWSAEHEIATRRMVQPALTRLIIDNPDGFLIDVRPFESGLVLERNLLNLRGLPIDDGTLVVLPDGTSIGGATVPYDLEYTLLYKTESLNVGVERLASPLVNKSVFKLRPLYGVRYMHVRERFGFRGEDSGLSYENLEGDDPFFPMVKLHSIPNGIDDNLDGIVDNAGFIEDFDDEADAVRLLRNDLVAQLLGLEHPGRYQAFLDNEARSHFLGPEAGLQYELGGRKFRLSGHTKFGVLVNHERMFMRGNNIGNANDIGNNFELDVDDFGNIIAVPGDGPGPFYIQDSPILPPTVENPFPNFFTDRTKHTTLSPLFEQSIMAEVALFAHVPIVNKLHVLREAQVHVGYTFILLGNVARPSDSIVWQGNPRAGLFPFIDIKRGVWWTSAWNFGLGWTY